MTDPRSSPIPKGLLVLAFALGFLLAFRPVAGMDAHWHLAMGEAHLQEGLLLDTDPITWLPQARPSDMGSWGGQVALAWAHRLGGLAAARFLAASMAGLLLVLVASMTWRRTERRELVFLAVAIGAALALHRFRLRPDLFSIPLGLVFLDLCDRPLSRRRDAWLFLLALCWTNIHPSVVVAPVLAACAAAGTRSLIAWRAPVLVALAASIRPRGPIDLIDIAIETARTSDLVPEWQGLWSHPFKTFWSEWFVLSGVLAGFILALVKRKDRTQLLPMAALILALRAVRLSYYATFTAIATLGRLKDLIPSTQRAKGLVLIAAALIALPSVLDRIEAAAAARDHGIAPFADLYAPRYPVEAAGFLEGSELKGRLFHPVRWGGYLGERLAPRYRSAHDGRITIFGRELADELLAFADRKQRGPLASRYGIEILVLPPALLAPEEILPPGAPANLERRWRIVHRDPTAIVALDALGEHYAANLLALGLR